MVKQVIPSGLSGVHCRRTLKAMFLYITGVIKSIAFTERLGVTFKKALLKLQKHQLYVAVTVKEPL